MLVTTMHPKLNFSLCLVVALIGATQSSTTMKEFFPEVFNHGNLSEITWDHAVNTKKVLAEALANDKHMVEADVLLGHLIHAPKSALVSVVMGHPPMIVSDLSLKDFMDTIAEHNRNAAASNRTKKGVKLDFKDNHAYARAMSSEILLDDNNDTLKSAYGDFPLWINGDIAKGPGHPWIGGVDLKLEEMKQKPALMDSITWSLGWTTGENNANEKYTFAQIDAMKTLVQGIGNVTFPVRAMYAARSLPEMESLLEVGTLTIWSAKQDDDHVDVVELAKLIREHLDGVYVDVPETLQARLAAVQ